jgi:hypothetical protein
VKRAVWTLAVLLSHWRRHPMQLATLLIGLISATALWSGVQALNQQARTSYDRAAATFGGARTAMLVGRDSPTFPQQLFVDLRRAGWPVSPVLEGRLQIGGRSFRLLGIEPVTLPREVGSAPTIGRADLQPFMTPPGQMLVAPETLADLRLAEGATPSGSRNWCRACSSSTSASRSICSKCRVSFPGCWSARARASLRRWKALPAMDCGWSHPMRKAISNGSPTAFIST